MPNTTLAEAAPTTALLYERLRQGDALAFAVPERSRWRSRPALKGSTSAQFPIPNASSIYDANTF
jgi:hypothetical protein